MTNFYKNLFKSLLLAGLLVAPLQNYAAAQGPFSDPEALPECITLKFQGSIQSVQVPRGALMRSELGRNTFSDNAEETELVLDQLAGFSLKEVADILQVTAWQKYLQGKDDLYLYRLWIVQRYFGLPDLYEALTTQVANIAHIFAAKSQLLLPITQKPTIEENKFAQDSAKKVILDRTLVGHTNYVRSVAWSPDRSQIVSGSWDNTVRIWNATTGNLTRTLNGHTNSVNSVAWSPDSSQIASGSYDNTVRIWDAATGENTRTLNGHTRSVESVAWSPDGSQIVSGSWDNTVRIWNAATGNLARTLNGHTNSVNSVAWSPDGKQIVSGSWDRTVRIWNAFTGVLIKTLNGYTGRVTSVAWSPDGKQIVSGSHDNTVRIWDVATGKKRQTLNGHTGQVFSVAWSPDGSHIVSGSWDDTVRIWNAATGESRTLNRRTGRVYSVAWSPDGSQIVSGSYDNTVRIWNAHIRDSAQAKALLLAWIQAQEFAFEQHIEQQKKMSDFIIDNALSLHGLPKVFFKGDQVEIRSTIKLLGKLKKQTEKIETQEQKNKIKPTREEEEEKRDAHEELKQPKKRKNKTKAKCQEKE